MKYSGLYSRYTLLTVTYKILFCVFLRLPVPPAPKYIGGFTSGFESINFELFFDLVTHRYPKFYRSASYTATPNFIPIKNFTAQPLWLKTFQNSNFNLLLVIKIQVAQRHLHPTSNIQHPTSNIQHLTGP